MAEAPLDEWAPMYVHRDFVRMKESPDGTLQVSAPHFVAGVVLVASRVTEAAPILRYMRGWSYQRVLEFAKRKGWLVARVTSN